MLLIGHGNAPYWTQQHQDHYHPPVQIIIVSFVAVLLVSRSPKISAYNSHFHLDLKPLLATQLLQPPYIPQPRPLQRCASFNRCASAALFRLVLHRALPPFLMPTPCSSPLPSLDDFLTSLPPALPRRLPPPPLAPDTATAFSVSLPPLLPPPLPPVAAVVPLRLPPTQPPSSASTASGSTSREMSVSSDENYMRKSFAAA